MPDDVKGRRGIAVDPICACLLAAEAGHTSDVMNIQHAQPNAGLMLGKRRRRWPNSSPALGRYLVFAGNSVAQRWFNSGLRSHTWPSNVPT